MNALDVGYAIAGVLSAPWWARKQRGDWRGRFGHAETLLPPTPGRPRLLVHAVSVGEVSATRALVPMLAERADVVVSVTTDTGMARATELFGGGKLPGVRVVRFPLDFSRSVRRFLDATKPDAVGLIELELWPNFMAECERRLIPVAVVNGRLSERSFRGYHRFRAFLGPTFARLRYAAVQDATYAERFVAMGVPPTRCDVTGSMKWDAAPVADDVPGAEALATEMGIDRARPLVVGGSTGPGEEAMLHAVCGAIAAAAGAESGGVQLLCAPRKPERFEEAARALPGCVRRSERAPRRGDRFLLDSIGELRRAYALADVVVMGRTFVDLGGSDPIEPVALGKPTLVGPHMGNFSAVMELFKGWSLRRGRGPDTSVRSWEDAAGVVEVDQTTLGPVLARLLGDVELRARIGGAGRECVAAQRGSSRRHAELLLGLAYGSPPGTSAGPEGSEHAPSRSSATDPDDTLIQQFGTEERQEANL